MDCLLRTEEGGKAAAQQSRPYAHRPARPHLLDGPRVDLDPANGSAGGQRRHLVLQSLVFGDLGGKGLQRGPAAAAAAAAALAALAPAAAGGGAGSQEVAQRLLHVALPQVRVLGVLLAEGAAALLRLQQRQLDLRVSRGSQDDMAHVGLQAGTAAGKAGLGASAGARAHLAERLPHSHVLLQLLGVGT